MTQKELVEMLQAGVVRFTFTKKDGSERHAKGTLNMEIIPPSDRPTGAEKDADPAPDIGDMELVKYYDLEKSAWRSFRWDHFDKVRD